MNKNNIELNGFLTALLGLSIVGNVLRYIMSLVTLIPSIEYDGYSPLIWSTLCTAMIIASTSGILLKKRWGVLLMFGWGAIVLVAELIYPDFFGSNAFLHDLLIYVFWAGLLCLKCNGISAWKALLQNKNNSQVIERELASVDSADSPEEVHISNCAEKIMPETPIESLLNEVVGDETEKKEAIIYPNNMVNSTQDTPTSELDKNHDDFVESRNDEKVDGDFIPQVEKEKSTKCEQPEDISQFDKENADAKIETKGIVSTKRFRFAVVLTLVACASIGVTYWYVQYNSVENRYARANEYFHDGKTSKAIELYTQLAEEEGYIKAKTRLGLLFIFNDSIETDAKKGFKYLREAAVSDTLAMDNLLNLYRGVNAKGKSYLNSDNAIYYANMAIKNGVCLSNAYFTLGNAYSDKEDNESAFYYWNKAATEYHAPGAYGNLGWMYYNGVGCKENNERAFEYFSRAISIRDNDDFALYYLGLMYLNGYGVKKDVMQGKSYLKRSAELGNEDAKKEYARLEMN